MLRIELERQDNEQNRSSLAWYQPAQEIPDETGKYLLLAHGVLSGPEARVSRSYWFQLFLVCPKSPCEIGLTVAPSRTLQETQQSLPRAGWTCGMRFQADWSKTRIIEHMNLAGSSLSLSEGENWRLCSVIFSGKKCFHKSTDLVFKKCNMCPRNWTHAYTLASQAWSVRVSCHLTRMSWLEVGMWVVVHCRKMIDVFRCACSGWFRKPDSRETLNCEWPIQNC